MATVEDLKKARKERGISQWEVEQYLDIQSGHMSLYETGRKEMPEDLLKKALEYVGYESLVDKKETFNELIDILKEKAEEVDDIDRWLEIQKFIYQIYKENS